MLLSPGTCWFPTPPAILNPKPEKTGQHVYQHCLSRHAWYFFICMLHIYALIKTPVQVLMFIWHRNMWTKQICLIAHWPLCICLYYILTFRPFDQLDIHDSLSDAPPASYTQPDQTSCLLQSLHSPAVSHLPDVCVIHPDYTVVHPAQE